MNIEKYLVLNKYLLSLFGVSEFKDLQERLKDAQIGFDTDGKSYFINVLRSSFNKIKIPEDELLKYDQIIQSYVKKINYKRDLVNLKYFQYLAVLFTEIVLDNIKNKKIEFLNNLNNFLEKYKKEQEIKIIDQFTENDLRKIAFWMATGSGKTLIMHINYYQFMNYNLFNPDNIILITPNSGLSKQHFEELQKSGIPCKLYEGNFQGGIKKDNEVLVIEMTKFVEEKKGKGLTLPIETFQGKNLIFVDEGHKGKKSEEQKWALLRNKLSEDGFVFEYSATFGQILSESTPEILKEYSKSIIFDYSYKYFYLDGYGKDFFIFNVKNPNQIDNFSENIFIANLLSFYEQTLIYEENQNILKEYNIEKPLWIFVGTTVTGKQENSDVIQIVEFIKNVLSDEKNLKEKITKILSGNSGFKNENGEDIFKDSFKYLKNKGFNNIDDIYIRIFGGKGKLEIYELKNAEGELGLKVGENEYFGVINIGDISDFKKNLKNKIEVKVDIISTSLFDNIKKENSKINILIGSKKFIEGWDTWRVSSMGLLNIGQGQGPQIIQLFGRGIRLKGKNMSLKRSGEKEILYSLETLNIFSIRADYLNKFLEAINKEEIEFEEIKIPVRPQNEGKWNQLYILSRNEGKKFEEEEVLKLKIDKEIYFTIDLMPKFSLYIGKERREGVKKEEVKEDVKTQRILESFINLIDWNNITEEIYNFKTLKGYWNLIIKKETLKKLILSNIYRIYAPSRIFEIETKDDIRKLEEITLLVVKKYIDLFYRKYAKQFETKNMKYENLHKQKPLTLFESIGKDYFYTLQIDKKKRKIIEEIKELIKNLDKLYKTENNSLPRICFDKHLFIPILLQNKNIDKITPSGLVESEKKFVLGLKEYLKNNEKKFENIEIFLLRNFPKSGIGFFNLSGFYPDFIMWIKYNKKQHIIFIDPKGLEHTKGLDDEKIQLSKEIKNIEKEIKEKSGQQDIILDSLILSDTPYNDLIKGRTDPPSKDDYIKNHVLFLDENNWQEELFKNLIPNFPISSKK